MRVSLRQGTASLNEGRIAELESLIARAEVIDVTKLSGDTVKSGPTVKLVQRRHRGRARLADRRRYSEADAKAGRISISSPLARALIGKKAAPASRVNTPKGAQSYEVLEVRWGLTRGILSPRRTAAPLGAPFFMVRADGLLKRAARRSMPF